MSLITDALQKAQSRPADRPPEPPMGGRGWWSVGAVVAVLAVLWTWVGPSRWPHHRLIRATPTSAPATPAAPILSLLPATPVASSLGWRVDGIMTGMGEPLAIINGTTVAQGEQVNPQTKVVSVTHDAVELEHEDGRRLTLAVSKE